jgi:hypothetical protein
MDWINLAHSRDKRQGLEKTVMSVKVIMLLIDVELEICVAIN